MTIYQIKAALATSSTPYFFNTKALKFFGQTLKSFSVHKAGERFFISAPIVDTRGRKVGCTERFYNPVTNELEYN